MSAVYKSICSEADTFLLLSTKLAEKQIKLKLEVEKVMNDGFLKIARARYIMGSTCVTKTQLLSEHSNPIRAGATVGRRETSQGWIFYIIRQNSLKNNESNGNISEEYGESMDYNYEKINSCDLGPKKENFKYLLHNDPKSLKNSKNVFLIKDEQFQECNNELLDEISNSDSNESLISVTDPLRLFGILVPNALREAQMIFNNAVDLLGECATVQLQLREALYKYHHLEKVKSLIEDAAKEIKFDVITPKVYWTPTEASSTSSFSSNSESKQEVYKIASTKLIASRGDLKHSGVGIQKSVRSVFYDMKDITAQEAEYDPWGSGTSVVHRTSEDSEN